MDTENTYARVLIRYRIRLMCYVAAILTILFSTIPVAPGRARAIPLHTSILSGQGWVDELLAGHPRRILYSLGVDKHTFLHLIAVMRNLGLDDSRWVTLEEQLAIFLYASITGLTIRHVGERFQRSNATVSL